MPHVVVCAVTSLMLAAGAVAVRAQDVEGGKDHPAISRYAGSTLVGYEVRDFDELTIPLARIEATYPPSPPAKSEKVEGRVTRLVYVAPAERSSLEVLRNYQQELGKGGFETLFTCSGTACSAQGNGLAQVVYPLSRSQTLKGHDLQLLLTMPQDERFIAARRKTPQGTTYASVYVAKDTNPGVPRSYNRAVVLLEIVEASAMDTGMVTVDAAAMAKEIANAGHVALYGIHFDTNSAVLKPESEPALKEIAALMQQDAGLKLLVVGHTDSVGDYDANVALSNRRAAAVLQALTTKYGVAPARLRAVGVGMAAPVASNETEEGRARNRRVELVRQ